MRRQDRTTRTKRERAAAAAERDRLMSLLPDVFTAIDASNAWGVGTQKTTSGLRKLVYHGCISCVSGDARPMRYVKAGLDGSFPTLSDAHETPRAVVCRTCGVEKPPSSFTARKQSRTGYLLDCKKCVREKYARESAGKGEPGREKGGRDYAVKKEYTDHGTVIIWFGDKARMQPKGEHRKQTGPGGVQSSMGLFDAS